MSKTGQTPDLDSALQGWRGASHSEELLSQPTRTRILREAGTSHRRMEAVVPLFFPARRLALATILPLLVLSVTTAYLMMPGGFIETASGAEGPILQAVRQGDEVVFTIVNGGGSHLVRKSSNPNSLDNSEVVVVSDGAFRDRIDSGDDLVFYRID